MLIATRLPRLPTLLKPAQGTPPIDESRRVRWGAAPTRSALRLLEGEDGKSQDRSGPPTLRRWRGPRPSELFSEHLWWKAALGRLRNGGPRKLGQTRGIPLSEAFVWFHNSNNNPGVSVDFHESLLGWKRTEEPPGMTMFAGEKGPFATVGTEEGAVGWIP